MVMRGALVRALEWRARRFSDPAERLDFLRRRVGATGVSKHRRLPIPAAYAMILLLVLATGAGIYWWISPRHIATANANSVSIVLPRIPSGPHIGRLPEPAGKVWLVQSTPQFDLYSNGLRIESQYATSTAPRRYVAFKNTRGAGPGAMEWSTEPAGIVYHTTESHLAPFEEEQNQSLRRAGEGLLEYVSRRHSYHFVIDRFGRVFRVVRESDYANHAGNSVWADDARIYINLNQSFFGIAFEASSQWTGSGMAVNGAQIYSGRILTEMLRARYGIAPSNCVTHAQVSVNPSNFAVGYHRDWAANLPFAQLGLADNYALPPASVRLFGFEPDRELSESGATSMAEGLSAAAAQVGSDATAGHLPLERYREELRRRYRDTIRALRANGAYQENH